MKENKELCVFCPCTREEYRSKSLENSLTDYLSLQMSREYSFNFVFCFNFPPEEKDQQYKGLQKFIKNKNVNSVTCHSLDIDPKDDVYIKPSHTNPNPLNLGKENAEEIPKYGASSGPNLSFYRSVLLMIEKYNSYKYFFMFEIDSFPMQNNWMDKLFNEFSKKNFIIFGSKYKGKNHWHKCLEYKDHLNGVAVYKNSKDLKNLIEEVYNYHPKMISKKCWILNFDIAINKYIREIKKSKWKNKIKLFIDSDVIINISDPEDSESKLRDIVEQYPKSLIVHQKKPYTLEGYVQSLQQKEYSFFPNIDLNFDKTKTSVPVFLHFFRCGGTTNLAWVTTIFHEYCKKHNLEIINRDNSQPIIRIKRIHCDIEGLAEAVVFVYDKTLCLDPSTTKHKQNPMVKIDKKTVLSKKDPYVCNLKSSELMELVEKNNLDIFAIQISPHRSLANSNPRLALKFSLDLCSEADLKPALYSCIRKPFELTKSFYFQANKDNKKLSHEDFIDFLQSPRLHDSLIIRFLTGANQSEELQDFHLQEALRIMDHCQVDKVENITPLLGKVFNHCYGINIESLSRFPSRSQFNKSFLPGFLLNVKLEDLSKIKYKNDEKISLQNYYTGRSYFGEQLYKALLK